MKTEAAIYHQLVNTAGLVALVGARIFPVILEQDIDFPAVTYQRLGSSPIHASGSDATLRDVTMGIAVVADQYEDAKNVQAQVEVALTDFSGEMGGTGGVQVQRCFIENIAEDFSDDIRAYIVTLEFSVWAEEA